MRKWTCALASFLLCATAFAGTPLPDAPHVVVNGVGEVSVAPDWALVTMVASKRSADPAEAKRVVDRAVDALIAIAPRFDIVADDVTASDLQLEEEIDFDEDDRRKPAAHLASREVKVRIADLERIGGFVDAALAAGFTEIGDVDFRSSQEVRLRGDAQAAAVANAREKAAGLAMAFGGTLGPVYSINSLGSGQDQFYGRNDLDKIVVTGTRRAGGAYLQPKIEFSERVSAVFELRR